MPTPSHTTPPPSHPPTPSFPLPTKTKTNPLCPTPTSLPREVVRVEGVAGASLYALEVNAAEAVENFKRMIGGHHFLITTVYWTTDCLLLVIKCVLIPPKNHTRPPHSSHTALITTTSAHAVPPHTALSHRTAP